MTPKMVDCQFACESHSFAHNAVAANDEAQDLLPEQFPMDGPLDCDQEDGQNHGPCNPELKGLTKFTPRLRPEIS